MRANLKKTEITRALDEFNKLSVDTLVDVIDTFKDFIPQYQTINALLQSKYEPSTFKTIFNQDDFMRYQFSGFNLYSLYYDFPGDCGDDDDEKLKNVLHEMVLWFIADCSFATYHIVKSIRENNIWKITNKLIQTVYTMIPYYLQNNNKNQFIQNYKDNYEQPQFTKFEQEAGRRRGNQNTHTPEEEANMLYDEYAKYFKEQLCFKV